MEYPKIPISIRKVDGGDTISVEIEPSFSTIEQLKKIIEEKNDVPAASQQLVFNGKILNEGEKTLTECGIQKHCEILFRIKTDKADGDGEGAAAAADVEYPTIPIFIQVVSSTGDEGELLSLDVEPSLQPLSEIKKLIEERVNIPIAEQTLLYSGKLLNDDAKTMTSYNVAKNGTITVRRKRAAVTSETAQAGAGADGTEAAAEGPIDTSDDDDSDSDDSTAKQKAGAGHLKSLGLDDLSSDDGDDDDLDVDKDADVVNKGAKQPSDKQKKLLSLFGEADDLTDDSDDSDKEAAEAGFGADPSATPTLDRIQAEQAQDFLPPIATKHLQAPQYEKPGRHVKFFYAPVVPDLFSVKHTRYERSHYENRSIKLDDEHALHTRWRNKRDGEGNILYEEDGETPQKETNTRMVVWEDGSMNLYIGDEPLTAARNKSTGTFLYIHNLDNGGDQFLESFAPLTEKVIFKPASLTSKTTRERQLRITEKNLKSSKIKQIVMMGDPEKEQEAKMKARDDAIRLREKELRMDEDQYETRRRPLNKQFLEEDYDESGPSLTNLKKAYRENREDRFNEEDPYDYVSPATKNIKEENAAAEDNWLAEDDDEDDDDTGVISRINKRKRSTLADSDSD